METLESIKYSKDPQNYNSDSPIVNILDDIDEKEINDPRVPALFKRSRHGSISIFIISRTNTNCRSGLFGPTVICVIFSNQTISEMFKISIKTKHLWV